MAPSEETSSGGNSEGTSQTHDSSTSQQDSDNLPRQEEDDEEVRQKCLFLLNELVSRTEEANRRRLPHMEGGPVQCRLPLTKVSLALQAYSKHAPNVFQGHETAPLPNAITPFTPSSTKLPASPSIASATPVTEHTSTAKVVRAPSSFLFQAESHLQATGEDGQNCYLCDICHSKFDRGLSLKKHYLCNHINHRYLSERDVFSCGIVLTDRLPPT
ncbi:hypothetical protein L9F63_025625 [Diploptera punctata]|uniref:C2H2-type domain-containing protein n=1 Tax=Diploptera punctata TaxID=6984 RepID=A0AAD7Z816_DIPPU|nr:hypothetical protein L9F63_025625 [Diploptera punctata]